MHAIRVLERTVFHYSDTVGYKNICTMDQGENRARLIILK